MIKLNKKELQDVVSGHIRKCIENGGSEVLEAGCGRHWPFRMTDVDFTLTGVDMDEVALRVRQAEDLDNAILGNLKDVDLPNENFDIIYNAFVLEHVPGASKVLENFVRWLKPGGLMILKIPNRDSVYGLFTRITPLWIHVAYKRYIKGNKNAGHDGHSPYPTFYDRILSHSEFIRFANDNNLLIKNEAYFGKEPKAVRIFMKAVEIISFGRFSADEQSYLYVLQKPPNEEKSPSIRAASIDAVECID